MSENESDIVEWLAWYAGVKEFGDKAGNYKRLRDAAAEIERLREENAALRSAAAKVPIDKNRCNDCG